MPSNRIGYGYGEYSDADFGVEGVLQSGSVSISANSSFAANGGRSEVGSALIASVSSVVCNASAILIGEPSAISATATVTDVPADRIKDGSASIKSDSGSLYGYGNYGSDDYGKVTTFAVRIRTSGADIDSTATFTGAGVRIQQPSAQIDAVASLAADSDTIVNGRAVFAGLASLSGSSLRIRETSAQIDVNASTVIIAREKWEPILKVSEIWTEIA
jgi:hypothetical protein